MDNVAKDVFKLTTKGVKGVGKGVTMVATTTTKVATKGVTQTTKFAAKGVTKAANFAGEGMVDGVAMVGGIGLKSTKAALKATGVNKVYKAATGAKPKKKHGAGGEDDEYLEDEYQEQNEFFANMDEASAIKASHILSSAGTHRLNRILRKTNDDDENFHAAGLMDTTTKKIHKVSDPRNFGEVSQFVSRVVLPPLRVDQRSIGGTTFTEYPDNMQVETLLTFKCRSFEFTGEQHISVSCLQNPAGYAKHKRSLGMMGKGSKGRNKVHYCVFARSTNRPLLNTVMTGGKTEVQSDMPESNVESGYDKMFSPGDEDFDDEKEENMSLPDDEAQDAEAREAASARFGDLDSEISSFPVMLCMTLNIDGANPDIRKLIELDQLTTVMDVSATVVQLTFQNGHTIRFDFSEEDEDKAVEAGLIKERFVWSLLQLHAMLCVSVVERSTMDNADGKEKNILPPLNIRGLDRAELQYIATVNNFLRSSKGLAALLDRQQELARGDKDGGQGQMVENDEESKSDEGRDVMAYDLMMGNFATRVAIFQSADERAEAEEVLNSTEWTLSLNSEESAAATAAERLSLVLQRRMRDLEAETCRRLIAWEDEKHYSVTGHAGPLANRDTVDALSLQHLFTTLESLDSELAEMEGWLADRVLAIKPLTDDCRDIEEENNDEEKRVLAGVASIVKDKEIFEHVDHDTVHDDDEGAQALEKRAMHEVCEFAHPLRLL